MSAFYYNSWRFVPANLLFGGALLIVLAGLSMTLAGLVLTIALVPLAVGLMAMATRYARQRYVFFSDFAAGMRHRFLQNLALGTVQLVVMVVLAADLLIGLSIGGLLGSLLVVAAFYGLLAVWVLAVIAWPLVTDTERAAEPLRDKLRLAAVLFVAHPLRFLGVAAAIGVFLAVTAFLVVALLIFGVALAWLVAAHYVLPAADRLEGRETLEIED